jgi:hypothetical protein
MLATPVPDLYRGKRNWLGLRVRDGQWWALLRFIRERKSLMVNFVPEKRVRTLAKALNGNRRVRSEC